MSGVTAADLRRLRNHDDEEQEFPRALIKRAGASSIWWLWSCRVPGCHRGGRGLSWQLVSIEAREHLGVAHGVIRLRYLSTESHRGMLIETPDTWPVRINSVTKDREGCVVVEGDMATGEFAGGLAGFRRSADTVCRVYSD